MSATEQHQQQQRMLVNDYDFQLQQAHQRKQDIEEISRKTQELNQLMRDYSLLVDYQGDIVDNIEKNVISSHENAKKATEELREASRAQRESACNVM